jgi:hypothetical protein
VTMRKISALLVCLALFSFFSIPLFSQTEEKSKAIHIVYDDSVSMIKDRIDEYHPYKYSDRWAQNKYAMEVFAAMLEEKDTMNVYYLSDFDIITQNPEYEKGNTNASAGVEINGYDLQNGVKKIHDMVTIARNTPYDAVKKAYEDLLKKDVDVRWLVILSDGYFNQENGREVPEGSVNVNKYFEEYTKDIKNNVKIILLAMGDVADKLDIKQDRKTIYFNKAKNNDEILEQITEICNIIFNRSPYPFPMDDKQELEFDLPTEILVFAQGPSVEVYGIKGTADSNPRYKINVRYTEKEKASVNINYLKDQDVYTSSELTGIVAKFQNIPKGKYNLDIQGAKKVDVYIKPDVNLKIKMFGNKEIRVSVNKKDRKKYFDDVEEGRYKFQYGIIDDKGKYFEPEILNGITYEIKQVENNGEIFQINSGDSVKLTQGEFSVHVKVRYLNNNFKEEIIFGKVLPPRTFIERLIDWVKKYKWQLITIWGLFMIWFLWGRKNRFPKEMKKKGYKPSIVMEKNGKKFSPQNGKFTINKKTKYLPLCSEEGMINVVPIDSPTTIGFKVKATKDRDTMIIMNSSAFSPDKLSNVKIRVGNALIDKGAENGLEMTIGDTIQTIFKPRDGYPEIRYTCTLTKK